MTRTIQGIGRRFLGVFFAALLAASLTVILGCFELKEVEPTIALTPEPADSTAPETTAIPETAAAPSRILMPEPAPIYTITPTASPTSNPSATETATTKPPATPSHTPMPTYTFTPTTTSTTTPTATATATTKPPATPSHTPMPEPTPTYTFTPTATPTTTPTATAATGTPGANASVSSATHTARSTPQAGETGQAAPTENPGMAETPCFPTSDDGSDTDQSARKIFDGDSVRGEIRHSGEADHFVLCAGAGRAYEVRISAGSIPNVRLTAFDPRGAQRSSVRTDYLRRAASTILHSWHPGPFLLAVEGQGRGAYRLSVVESDYRDDHGDRAESATEITTGESVEGVIGPDRDVDFFKFLAVRGQFYTMSLSVAQNVHEPLTLRLQSIDGTELCGQRTLRTIHWAATENGYAYVSVSELRDEHDWTYNLTLEQSGPYDGHGDCASNATRITVDETVRASYETRGVDFFKFRADAGQAYQINLNRYCCSSVRIRNDRFDVVAHLTGLESATTRFEAWRSGDYFIEVDKNRARSYELTLSRSNYEDDHGDDFASASELQLGKSICGVIGTCSERDLF
ncbi:MAG: hypothetical protein F4034_04520 [Chloroflexi bacterium]|nr:hypothetical protein [Chloroflexota bacterium]